MRFPGVAAFSATLASWNARADSEREFKELPATEWPRVESRAAKARLDQRNHHTPSRFFPDDSFVLIPHERGKGLSALARAIAEHQAAATLSHVPMFPQLDPMIFWTHRAARIPHAAAAPAQIAVALELLRQLSPAIAIVTVETGRRLEMALLEAPQIPWPRAWYVIQPVGSTERFRPAHGLVQYDLHMAPGLSVAYQCKHLAESGLYRFHPSPDMFLEADGATVRATSHGAAPTPLLRTSLGAGALLESPCACGMSDALTL